jgi:hypothetical protein
MSYVYILLFLTSIHVWRYSPFWTLASLKEPPLPALSQARLLQPHMPRICNALHFLNLALWYSYVIRTNEMHTFYNNVLI